MHLDLLAHDEPFTFCNHGVRSRGLWGMFLSTGPPSGVSAAASSRFPGKSTGRPFGGGSRGANFPHGLAVRSPSSIGIPFHPPGATPRQRATPVLLLPLKRRPSRQRSPHRIRVTVGFHQRLIHHGLPTVGRRRASPVRHRTIFSRRPHVPPPKPVAGIRTADDGGSGQPLRFNRERSLTRLKGLNAFSRSISAWPLRDGGFSGPPGAPALAAYLR